MNTAVTIILLTVALVGSFAQQQEEQQPQTQQQPEYSWKLLHGDSRDAVPAFNGVPFEGGANVTPGSRAYTAFASDHEGNLWIFGGEDAQGALWENLFSFLPEMHGWTWVQGGDPLDDFPMDAPPEAQPSNRRDASLHFGLENEMILFGGQIATYESVFDQYSNQVYVFEESISYFKSISGSTTANTPTNSSTIGARAGHLASHDPSNSQDTILYVFGGQGVGSDLEIGLLSDLWRFNVTSRSWRLLSGSTVRNEHSVFDGDQQQHPGGRRSGAMWIDHSSGHVYLGFGFGWASADAGAQPGLLGDLWRFAEGRFELINDAKQLNHAGVYGATKGVYAAGIHPGARQNPGFAYDSKTRRLLLGFGQGMNAEKSGMLQDLWAYSLHESKWAWLAGGQRVDQPSSSADGPSGRSALAFVLDADGHVIVYGGKGVTTTSAGGLVNSAGTLADTWIWSETKVSTDQPTPSPQLTTTSAPTATESSVTTAAPTATTTTTTATTTTATDVIAMTTVDSTSAAESTQQSSSSDTTTTTAATTKATTTTTTTTETPMTTTSKPPTSSTSAKPAPTVSVLEPRVPPSNTAAITLGIVVVIVLVLGSALFIRKARREARTSATSGRGAVRLPYLQV